MSPGTTAFAALLALGIAAATASTPVAAQSGEGWTTLLDGTSLDGWNRVGEAPAHITDRTCYEVNIFDKRPDPTYGTGAIVNFAEVSPMPVAAGKWNTFEINAKGRHVGVVMNGQKTVELHNGLFTEGPITLQYGAGQVKFRKVATKPQ